MPKHVISALDRAKEFASAGLYSIDKSFSLSKYCNCRVTWDHNEKPKKACASSSTLATLQQTIGKCAQVAIKRKPEADHFAWETTEAFIKSNILLGKLQN
ncbi:hypothetical protein PR048_023671 [Dryococelus australis]|uniref:Uncharacterized protein n=1 Tax=Dryococelus australis TaxID=614101 RepID=A0ABQ9GUS5_9NEOP|nr:hypothetical protein PR048_023671 [Dryococelus australis]